MKTLFALVFAISMNAFAANDSVYTSVAQKDCRVTESSEWKKNPEIDYLTMFCAGKGGYKVKISGGDLRYPLFLIAGGRTITLTEIGAFHELGSDRIEWRGPAGTDRFTSLIYRLSIADENGNMSPSLYVVRLAGRASCVIGTVPQGNNMNERARQIADNENARCL